MFPDRLRSLRERKKKTQQDIADVLGITRPAYTAYESGSRKPDYEKVQQLAQYFDVTIDYLMGQDGVEKLKSDLDEATKEVIDEVMQFPKEDLPYLRDLIRRIRHK